VAVKKQAEAECGGKKNKPWEFFQVQNG
jgi:hypothetical protein